MPSLRLQRRRICLPSSIMSFSFSDQCFKMTFSKDESVRVFRHAGHTFSGGFTCAASDLKFICFYNNFKVMSDVLFCSLFCLVSYAKFMITIKSVLLNWITIHYICGKVITFKLLDKKNSSHICYSTKCSMHLQVRTEPAFVLQSIRTLTH